MTKEDIRKKARDYACESIIDVFPTYIQEVCRQERNIAFIDGAEWMQEQMIENACEVFCEMRCQSEMHFSGKRRCGKDTCNKLEIFKQALKGE